MPVGLTLSIGAMNHDDVVTTTAETVEAALAAKKNSAMLMFSCIGRNLALGFDTMAEMECVISHMGDKVPFLMAYSGGEVGPMPYANGYYNRFHNNTFVACIF